MSTRSTRHRACSSQGEIRSFEGMSKINTATAGVDIGAHEIMACVPDGDDQQLVRAFGTYTAEFQSPSRLVHRPRESDSRHGIHGRLYGSRSSRRWKPMASAIPWRKPFWRRLALI